jgi:thiamine pyrophosphate-dependent acetolactate synthase large subunit-like protein
MAVPMHRRTSRRCASEVFPKDGAGRRRRQRDHLGHVLPPGAVPNTLVSTFKFGMLGAGTSQALGAAAAFGRASRCAASSATAPWASIRRRSRPRCGNKAQVIYIVLCDKQWGMVKMNQQFMLRPLKTMLFKHLDPDETIKADLGEIRFDKLGAAMGAYGERVSDPKRAASRRCSGRSSLRRAAR